MSRASEPSSQDSPGPRAPDQTLRDFTRSLPMSLLRAREAVMDTFRPHLHELGVTEQQWRVLRALAGGHAWRLNELAAKTCISMPSLSRIVPTLVERGWLARRADAADGRSSIVHLSDLGQAFIDTGAERSEAIYQDIEQRFGVERLTTLYALLDDLSQALDDPGPVDLS